MVVFFSLSDRKLSKMFSWAQILLISILHNQVTFMQGINACGITIHVTKDLKVYCSVLATQNYLLI